MPNDKKETTGEVIDLFAKKAKKEEEKESDSEEYFRKLEEANKVKKEKLAKERLAKNKKVTRDYNLTWAFKYN